MLAGLFIAATPHLVSAREATIKIHISTGGDNRSVDGPEW
jgi:hypothetical protein